MSFIRRKKADQNEEELHSFVEAPENNIDGDPFLYSLETLTPDDIAPEPPKKKRSGADVAYDTVRNLILAVCIGVFLFSGYKIVLAMYDYHRAAAIYDEASKLYAIEDDAQGAVLRSKKLAQNQPTPDFADSQRGNYDEVQVVKPRNEEFEKMKANLNAIKIINPDVYGWIKIPGTSINYVIMQSEDNDYYLDHAYTGVSVPAGSIFADFRCSSDIFSNFNTVLYGHNMQNGLMFHEVTSWLDSSFFEDNRYIYIYTFDGIYTFEIFSIYQTKYDYKYIDTYFPTVGDFVDFANEMADNSLFEREDIEFSAADARFCRILTLSTCTNGHWTGRYTLQAKLVDFAD